MKLVKNPDGSTIATLSIPELVAVILAPVLVFVSLAVYVAVTIATSVRVDEGGLPTVKKAVSTVNMVKISSPEDSMGRHVDKRLKIICYYNASCFRLSDEEYEKVMKDVNK